MYRVVRRDDGQTVATFQFDPFQFDMKTDNGAVESILSSMEQRRQMNRTPGGERYDEGDEDAAEHGTSPETYQDPSKEFLLSRIGFAFQPGFTVFEVEGDRE